ncbi:MAG: aminoacyl-tRNA hydrolase [Actinomycetota bacterium]|nr:aminoacyl-tRNA hydrolase [Actinomycetota bacterium]
MATKLIVGLRNPGSRYDGTRHNVGAEVIAATAPDVKFKRARLGIRADVAEIRSGDVRTVLALPRTFMNECGQAVAPLARYERIDGDRLLIVHDDIDLPFGKIRVQFGGGAGGHNGIRSLVGSLDTKDFWRLKIGVGRPPSRVDPADYVLGRFAKVERSAIDDAIVRSVSVLETFARDGGDAARQRVGELND